MQTTKPKFDPDSPEIKAYEDELAHQFVREGTMVAFPTCLPGMTTPITHDESRITALDINVDGHVYGGTSGRQAHLFGAAFHGVTGIVLDAGIARGCHEHRGRLLRPVGWRDCFRERSRRPAAPYQYTWISAGLDTGVGAPSRCRSKIWASALPARLWFTRSPRRRKYRRRCHDAAPVYHRFRIGTYCCRGRSAGSRSTRRESRRGFRTR